MIIKSFKSIHEVKLSLRKDIKPRCAGTHHKRRRSIRNADRQNMLLEKEELKEPIKKVFLPYRTPNRRQSKQVNIHYPY